MAQYDINLREYWRILKKRKLVVFCFAVVFGLFSIFYGIFTAPESLYTSVCSIKFEKETTIEGLYASTFSWTGADPLETQMSVIKGYPVFQKVAERLRLIPVGAVTEDGQLKEDIIPTLEDLQSSVEVSREEYTSILNIEVTHKNPVFAQRLANTVARTYKDLHAEEQTKKTTDALQYIEEQLGAVREELRMAEEEFNRFSQENQLISLEMQSEVLLATSQELRNKIRSLEEDKRELGRIYQRLGLFVENPVGSDHDFYATQASSKYQDANNTLVGLLLKKDTLLEDFTPQHPEVVGIGRKIIEISKKMLILLQLGISEIDKKKADLREEVEEVERTTSVLMDKEMDFNRLKRRVDSYNDRTILLERREQEALIRKAEKPEEVAIVRQALLPTAPINPPKTVVVGVLGIFIGLIVGIIVGFVVETFDTSIGAIEDVEDTLGTQVLGIIPQVDAKDIRESLKEIFPDGIKESNENQLVYLVSHFVPKSMIAESFRALRTNVQFKDSDKKIKSVAVASTSPEEGKTVVTLNLAMTMAQAGMKILLVGSDLRKPVIDGLFGVERAPGLTDILMGNYPWRDTVKTVTDIIMGHMGPNEVMMTPGLDNLHIITSGPIPPNPAELLDSGHLSAFIKEAEEDYDLILFDSPPILSTADAAILAAKVDGVLLVYRVGAVSRGLLRRSKAQLDRVHCNLMGVVLNGMRADVSPDFQDYKYYSYNYTYGEEEKTKDILGRIRDTILNLGAGGRQDAGLTAPAKDKKEGLPKRLNKTGLALAVIAVIILAIGFLMQGGMIDSFWMEQPESGTKDEPVSTAIGKRPLKETVQREPERISARQKTPAPEETGVVQLRTPTPEPKQPQVSRETPVALSEKVSEPTIPRPEPEPTSLEEMPLIKRLAPVKEGPSVKPVPYSLHLDSFRTLEPTKKAMSFYEGMGTSPFYVKVDLGEKGQWYRIFAGVFEDSEKAEAFKENYDLKEGTVFKTAYANLIDTYTLSDQLQAKMRSLRDLDYFPYIIEDHDGRYRLLVGAFTSQEGADKQCDELKSKGIQNRVIKR